MSGTMDPMATDVDHSASSPATFSVMRLMVSLETLAP
jgi:hypothetical protein